MFYLYILYSLKKAKYYIGYTGDDLNERLRKHNSNHKGFAGNDEDWYIVHTEKYLLKTDAQKREREIKGWKSKKMIGKLIGSDHPDS